MRLVQLTPGTGHFYCGNCLRDSALGSALRRQGHDVTMSSLYLPVHTEPVHAEQGDPPPRVFLGGIGMYLRHRAPRLAPLARLASGLLDRPSLLRWASRMGNMTSADKHADMTLAMIQGPGDSTVDPDLEALLDHLERHDRPDAVCLCNALLVGLAGPIRRRLGVPVVMTLHGEDAYLDALPEPFRSNAWEAMRRRVHDVDAIIAVSRYYADRMAARLDPPPGVMHVVHNGTPPPTQGPRPAPARPTLGYLARMCPDKGLHTLVDAFIELASRGHHDLHLAAAGVVLKPDLKYLEAQRRKLEKARLEHRAAFYPNVTPDHKQRFLRELSALSVPALYGEAFGLYLIEAMAHGVPVVQPRHAAFPEVIGHAGGGLLVAPDDPLALADALESLITQPDLARSLSAQAHAAVTDHFNDDRMARQVAGIIHALLHPAGHAAQPDPAQPDPAQPDPAQHDTAQHAPVSSGYPR